MAENNSTLATLVELRNAAEVRLKENADYIELLALRQAIAAITGEPVPDADQIISMGSPPPRRNGSAADVNGLSQSDAAHVLLQRVLGEPQLIANLVKALNAHGIRVGGTNPNINLSSILSKDDRFRSVRYKDRKCWWIEGTPFPGELDAR
jgi:hypothetical protein